MILTLCAALSFSHAVVQAAPEGETIQEIVFDGGLKGGWQDWGWAHREITPLKPARLQFVKYAGWILANRAIKGRFTTLSFNVKAPASFGDFLEVRVGAEGNDSLPRIKVNSSYMHPGDDGFSTVRISMKELNPGNVAFDRIVFRANKGVGEDWTEVDKVILWSGPNSHEPAPEPVIASSRPVKLKIQCKGSAQPISPYIYGIAFSPRRDSSDQFLWELSPTIRRWGGNPASRYNWKLGNAWNSASDWFFKNLNYTNDGGYTWKTFLEDNQEHHVGTSLTVPMIGYVAKDTESVSFPVSEYGEQKYASGDAGNGVRKAGGKITPGDPHRTSLDATPEFVGEWVRSIVKFDKEKKTKHVQQYILDNEPALWSSTHRDVHPNALTYDELLDRTIRYGTEVRRADPDAVIAGPAEWGWPAYFFSAKDQEVGFALKPDRRAHGDVPLMEWYLRNLHAHQQKTGVHILDVLDVHYYPQTGGVYGGGDRVDPAGAEKRIRSTRSLWDPSYKDESWIADHVELIPRLKRMIAENYPGLKISIGEYNFGGEHHISGALALAEVLGRFGQYGVYSAYYWTYPPAGSAAYEAFRAYRNYDGNGAQFLDHSLPATGDAGASIFASRNDAGTKMTAIALNLDAQQGADAEVVLEGCGDFKATRVFQYAGDADGIRPMKSPAPVKAGAVRAALPPYSLTVFELTR